MATEQSPRVQQIAEIFDPSTPVVSSKLVYLSNLNNEELELVKKLWANTDASRRHQIISQLVHLSEVDVKLDFSSIFVSCLHDNDATVRSQAIAGLDGEENYTIITPLLHTLKEDESAEVRAAAAVALGKFALLCELGKLPTHFTDKVYTALLDVWDNRKEATTVKRRALEAISPFNLPRIRELITQAYQSNDIKLKASAMYAMGHNCDSTWLNILLAELNNKEAEIRYEVAHALGELGAEEAVPSLLKLTEDKDNQVQEAAIKALGEIGGEQAKQALIKLSKDHQSRIREAAKSALKEVQFCEDPLSLQT